MNSLRLPVAWLQLSLPLFSLICCMEVLYRLNNFCLVTGSTILIIKKSYVNIVNYLPLLLLAGFFIGLVWRCGLLSLHMLSHRFTNFEKWPMLTPLSKMSWKLSISSFSSRHIALSFNRISFKPCFISQRHSVALDSCRNFAHYRFAHF